jgi:hypothetical protein
VSTEQPHGFEVRQEEDVVADRRLTQVGVLVLVVSVVSVGVAALLLGKDQTRLAGESAERPKTEASVAPPTLGIIEQTLIEHEARGTEQRRVEEERLHRYGWVDRDHGVARIPIDKAMDLVVAESVRTGVVDGGSP